MTTHTAGHTASRRRLPLPLATGGIGLLVTYSLPGGLSGGHGFLIGLTIGAGILGIAALLASRVAPMDQGPWQNN
jgi:hypothetical protein